MDKCISCGSTDLFMRDCKPTQEMMPVGGLSLPQMTVTVCGSCGHAVWHCKPHTLQQVRETFKSIGADGDESRPAGMHGGRP